MKKERNNREMLEEYDFSQGVRGKYSEKYAEGTNLVVIDPDVAVYFPDHDSVNDALRSLAEIIKKSRGAADRQITRKSTLRPAVKKAKGSGE